MLLVEAATLGLPTGQDTIQIIRNKQNNFINQDNVGNMRPNRNVFDLRRSLPVALFA